MILIDTSAWIQALRKKGNIDLRKKVEIAHNSGYARFCEPVILELYNGARGDHEINKIKKLEESVPSLLCDQDAWIRAIKYAKTLRSSAYTIPAIDILIQAIGDENGAKILADDKHFDIMKKVLNL